LFGWFLKFFRSESDSQTIAGWEGGGKKPKNAWWGGGAFPGLRGKVTRQGHGREEREGKEGKNVPRDRGGS